MPEVPEIDAALTVATRSRTRRGRGAASTRAEYAREWKRYGAWCRPAAVDGRRERNLDPTNTSAEQLATYVEALIRLGLAPGTIWKALAAIEANLRSRGALVPDSVPAGVVLRAYEDTRAAAGMGPKRAEPLSLDEFLLMLAQLDPSSPAGQRDAAALHLLFAELRVAEIAALQLGSFTAGVDQTPDRPVPLTIVLGDTGVDQGHDVDVDGPRFVQLLHWRSEDGTHDPRLCPVEAVLAWFRRVSPPVCEPSWPYMRPVDEDRRIGGIDPGWKGRRGGVMAVSSLRTVFNRVVAAAGLETGGRRIVPQSLRLAGVNTQLAQGAPGLGAFVAGGWSARSGLVARLLTQHTPDSGVTVTVPAAGVRKDGG